MPRGSISIGTLSALIALCGSGATLPAHADEKGHSHVGEVGGTAAHSHEGLPNLDIRVGEDGSPVQRVRDALARRAVGAERIDALARLRERVAFVAVDDDPNFGTPRFVRSWKQMLTQAAPGAIGESVVRDFVKEYGGLVEVAPAEISAARVSRDYVTAHNGVRHLTFTQQIEGVDMFGAEIRANLMRDGRLINFSSTMLPRPENDFTPVAYEMTDEEAIRAAAASVGVSVRSKFMATEAAQGASQKRRWNNPPELRADQAVTTERVYFPVTREEIRPAWYVVIPTRGVGHTYEIVIDGVDGTILHRRNQLACDTTEPITMRVYPGRSPTPGPGNFTSSGFRYPFGSRRLITTNPSDVMAWSTNGWIDDGVTETLGNNVDAHLDRDANNVPDLPRPNGGPMRIFDFPQDNGAPPLSWSAASVVHAFYVANVYHDRLYAMGFDEVAGNFQANNFGRGGNQNDAIQLDCQDGSGTNNANFSTPADGTAGRCQMYIFTGPNPDRDSGLDGDVLIHELTHGTSNRLSGGLSNLQSRGMGEGWSDFFGTCMAAVPGEDPHGVYCFGGYTTNNYYNGIRRRPYTTDMSKNPLTWDSYGTTGTTSYGITRSTAVHGTGEVWCVGLWECRAGLYRTMGFAANDEIMQLAVDGMKLQPANPTFAQARDGVLQADLVNNGGANALTLWNGFAKRGLGLSFTTASSSATSVTEAFDTPPLPEMSPDAGEQPATAQVVAGSGALAQIAGSLGVNDVDVYRVGICDFANFSASTVGGAGFDTQLFLFTTAGVGISFNDDASGTPQSTLTGQFLSANGDYLLAVSAADRDPASSGGAIWLDAPVTAQRGPDGPGAGAPLSAWSGTGDPGGAGTYTIVLNGACASSVGAVVVEPKALTAFGEPSPPSVLLGATPTVQFFVYVYRGTVPPSTGVTVSLDASSIGLGALTLADLGTNGDASAGDGIYSAQRTLGALSVGNFNLPYTVTDAQGRVYADTTVLSIVDFPGACCLPSGVCVFQTRALCFAEMGDYKSVGLTCDIRPCLPRSEVEPNGSIAEATNAQANFQAYLGSMYHNGVSGEIPASTDNDYFAIGAMQVGDVLTITQYADDSGVGTMPDAFVRLYRSGSTNVVISDDDSGPTQDSLIFKFAVTTADTYFVRADGFDTNGTAPDDLGTYKVGLMLQNSGTPPNTGATFTAEVEPNETKGAASNDATSAWRQVRYISTTSGIITSSGDSDFYKFTFAAGDVVSTNVSALPDLDARVNLRDAAGNILISENGGSTGPNGDSPLFGVVIPSTGDYFLEVLAAAGTGPYYSSVYLSSNTPPVLTCLADFNTTDGITVADIFAFLGAWFANSPAADFNGTGGITVADIFAFLTAWFAGCG